MTLRGYLYAGAVFAALAVFTVSHWKAYQAGRSTEQARILRQIEKENDDAAESAEDWRARLRACNAYSGKLFNFETGACE